MSESHRRAFAGVSGKVLTEQAPWSEASYARAKCSAALSEPLEYWLRAQVELGLTDDDIRDKLLDDSGIRIATGTITKWRQSLGLKKRKVSRKVAQDWAKGARSGEVSTHGL